MTTDALIARGVAAMNAGQFAQACETFSELADLERHDARALVMRGQCRMALGDAAEAEADYDRALDRNGNDLAANLLKGDARKAAGDIRAALTFWQHALAIAQAQGQAPRVLLDRLSQLPDEIAATHEHLRARLSENLAVVNGLGDHLPRMREALDLLDGRRDVFFQQPTSFYFPGLPQIQFYDPADFHWVADLEAATPAIRTELEHWLASGASSIPYMQADPNRPRGQHALLNDPSWSALYLWKEGEPQAEALAACPTVARLLDTIDQPAIARRSPMVLFSVLEPHTRIAPHHGLLNTRLICHLPLIVPEGCFLRVGNETRPVEPGKMMIFDDSIEHEAWNDSNERRIILLFEIWRPELRQAERQALITLFETVALA